MQIDFILVDSNEKIKETAGIAKEIWNEYFPPLITQEQTDYMVRNFQSVQSISKQIQEGYEYYFITASGNNVIGYFAVHEEETRLFLSKIYIYKQERGKGYASRAFEYIEKVALDKGLNYLYLYVFRGNENSITVYEKRGFKIIRDVDTDIGGGFTLTDYEMEKTLV